MSTKSQRATESGTARRPSHPIYMNEGLSPKKTALIIVTVIGCIAILWPKVFYPMMFGGTSPKSNAKDQRSPGGCCDVVLDREEFLNATPLAIGPQLYRKQLNLYTGEMSIRQERPAHLHPDSIYQAMRERGRAIPATQTVPILERKGSPSNPPPRYVDGRPGPIPGMRPPMGAGALHQAQPKGSSMGFVMPLYTIGIIVFFGYTIMKIVFKKPIPNAPYGAAPTDPNFRKQVFGQNGRHVEDLTTDTKLVVTAIQGLIDAADEELKLRETNTTSDLSKQSNENATTKNGDITVNGHTNRTEHESTTTITNNTTDNDVDRVAVAEENQPKINSIDNQQRKRRDESGDRSVAVLGMELTVSCEGGQKWIGRPPTPVFLSHNEHSKDDADKMPEPQSIYLEGSLANKSKILVADSQTRTEEVYDEDLNGTDEEPAVVLSSKMTLSLIDLSTNTSEIINGKNDIESPLADDIEIIGHDEN